MNTIQYALQKIGVERPCWQTVVVSASEEIALPRQLMWETWMKLEEWAQWAMPLHVSTRWIGKPSWRVGATVAGLIHRAQK